MARDNDMDQLHGKETWDTNMGKGIGKRESDNDMAQEHGTMTRDKKMGQ